MVGRKRRMGLAPSVEPMESREVMSGLLIALAANVPHLGQAQVASVASSLSASENSKVSAKATTSENGVYIGNGTTGGSGPAGPNASATFPVTPLLGQGTPTKAELAREKFTGHFSGPMVVQPPRFSDQSKIIYMHGLGTAPNFFLHGDYDLAIAFPAGFNPKAPTAPDPATGQPYQVTGFAFLDDKNNNSGAVEGLDLLADPTSFDAKGRPTRLTFTSDQNIYGGEFYVAQSSGVVTITYGKNTSTADFAGRIYTSGLTSPFQNNSLYAKHPADPSVGADWRLDLRPDPGGNGALGLSRRVRGGPSVPNPIQCPHCLDQIALKDSRPGRFRLKCPRCESPFTLTVPDNPDAEPFTTVLPPASPSAAKPFDPEETADQPVLPPVVRPTLRPAQGDSTIEQPRGESAVYDPSPPPPRRLGDYRVGDLIGPTRIGSTYRAIRRSTGRAVALGLVRSRWAADASFVGRFAREAYASAQLSHPNLASPTDLDVAKGLPFAATDVVGFEPLSDPARGRSSLDRTARAAAILHAARGLRLAHEQGVFHRDITLEKIRVNPRGLVRLSDVGLGLTPDTPVEVTVPVPGQPAPADSPAATAARDDLAALGRALMTLTAGREGDRASTPGMATLARKMAGIDSEARFNDVGAAVRALEVELGVGGLFTPRDDEAQELEAAVRGFQEPPMVKVRSMIGLALPGLTGFLAALLLIGGRYRPAIEVVSFFALVVSSLVAFRGWHGREPVFDRIRELVLGGSRGDKLTVVAVSAVVVVGLMFSGLIGQWVFLTTLAAGLAAAIHFAVDRPIEQGRAEPLARASILVRNLRLLGVDEDGVQRFVARQSGPDWEEFFEALFGYEAKRSARTRWGTDAGGKRRRRYAFWRDPVVDAIDAKLGARRRERDLALFGVIEERAHEARGINLLTARRKGRRVAQAIVQFAHQYRGLGDQSFGGTLMDALNRVALRPDDYLATVEEDDAGPPAWQLALDFAAHLIFGPRARFLLGGVCIAGCLAWLGQNDLVSLEGARRNAEEVKQAGIEATKDREQGVEDIKKVGQKLADQAKAIADAADRTKALEIGGVSRGLTSRVDGFGWESPA